MIGPSAALLFARRGTCLARCLSVKINKIAIDVSQFPQHLQQYAPGLRRALLSTLFLYHISTGLYPSALGCAWVVVLSRKLPSIWGWAFLFFCARKKKHWVRVSSSKVPISLLLSVGAAYFPFLARIHFLVGEGVFYKRGYCGLGGWQFPFSFRGGRGLYLSWFTSERSSPGMLYDRAAGLVGVFMGSGHKLRHVIFLPVLWGPLWRWVGGQVVKGTF